MAKARKASKKKAAKKTRRGKPARSKTKAGRAKSKAKTVKRKKARKTKKSLVGSVVDTFKESLGMRDRMVKTSGFEGQ